MLINVWDTSNTLGTGRGLWSIVIPQPIVFVKIGKYAHGVKTSILHRDGLV